MKVDWRKIMTPRKIMREFHFEFAFLVAISGARLFIY